MAKKLYEETQRNRNWFSFGLVLFLIAGLTYRFVEQYFFLGNTEVLPLPVFLVLLFILVSCLVFLYYLRLTIRMTDKSIRIRYYPWHKGWKKVKWSNIESVEIVRMPPSAEWNGWNVHFSRRKHYAINGNGGLHLTTRNGEDIFIGTHHVNEMARAVRAAIEPGNA